MANTPISPKVTAAGAVGGLVGMFLAFANSATPEMFDSLGKWGYPVFLAISLGAALIAAFLKNDPLRVVPQNSDGSHTITSLPAAPIDAAPGAPAATFPKAAVDAALAAEPAPAVEVTPVYTAPAPVA